MKNQNMQLQKLINMFGGDLQRRYGEKIHKLTLHGGFSCPNRDGTLGRGGCTFCNVASFADEQMQQRSIAEQLAAQAGKVNRARRYLAYFQAYTSTYAEVQVLASMYRQALTQADMVGLCVGTGRIAYRIRCWTCWLIITRKAMKSGWSWGYKAPTTARCDASIAGMISPVTGRPRSGRVPEG